MAETALAGSGRSPSGGGARQRNRPAPLRETPMTQHNIEPTQRDRELLERLNRLLPVSWDNETNGYGEPIYANLTFGDHQTQAMTMCPDDWMALNDIPAAIASAREAGRVEAFDEAAGIA